MQDRVERSLRDLMVSMFFGACMAVCISPYIMTTILRGLDASVFQIALIPVIIQAGGFLSLPMGILCTNFNPKKAAIFCYSIGRTFLAGMVVVLLLPDNAGGYAVALLLACFTVLKIMALSSVGPTHSWLSQVIPGAIQGSFMGKRSALAFIVTGVMTPLLGLAIERHSVLGFEKRSLYVLLLFVAVIAGYIDLWFLSRVEGSAEPDKKSVREIARKVREVFRCKGFLHAATAPVIAGMTAMLVTPFLILLYYDMGMSEFRVGVVMACETLGNACGLIVGGRLADRLIMRGIFTTGVLTRMVVHVGLLWVSVALVRASISVGAAWPVVCLLAFVGMAAHTSIQAAQLKYAYTVVRDRSSISFAFIAFVRSTGTLLVLALAARFGSLLARSSDRIAPLVWHGYHYAQGILILSLIAGAGSLLYLRRSSVYRPFMEVVTDV